MTKQLRIAIADDETDMRDFFVRMLPRCGHTVVSAASSGLELIEHSRKFQPNLIISDVRMPQLDGIEASQQVYHERPTPIILVSAHHDSFENADCDFAVAHLVKPIRFSDLQPTIDRALQSFDEIQLLQLESLTFKQAIADHKLISDAKRILVMREEISDVSAFLRLQALAAGNRRKLVEIAQSIIASAKLK